MDVDDKANERREGMSLISEGGSSRTCWHNF